MSATCAAPPRNEPRLGTILRRTSEQLTVDAIAAGRDALARGAWTEASACFQEALGAHESAEASEGLGIAARHQLDAVTAQEAHERGYRLARASDDPDLAARLAMQLAYDAVN